MRKDINKSAYMYLAVGGTAFLVEFALFGILVELGIFVVLAQSLSFCVGLMISFTGNRNITFKNGDYAHTRVAQLWRYVSLAIVNLGLSSIAMYVLVEILEVQSLVAKIFVMATIVGWNYLIFNKVIFRKK